MRSVAVLSCSAGTLVLVVVVDVSQSASAWSAPKVAAAIEAERAMRRIENFILKSVFRILQEIRG